MTFSSICPHSATYCVKKARSFGPADRVSMAACSGGSRYVSASGSYSTKPPTTIAPNHSRT